MQWQLLARIFGNIVIVALVKWHVLPASYLQLSDSDLILVGVGIWGGVTYGWNRYEAYKKGLTPGSPNTPVNLKGIEESPKELNAPTAPSVVVNKPNPPPQA